MSSKLIIGTPHWNKVHNTSLLQPRLANTREFVVVILVDKILYGLIGLLNERQFLIFISLGTTGWLCPLPAPQCVRVYASHYCDTISQIGPTATLFICRCINNIIYRLSDNNCGYSLVQFKCFVLFWETIEHPVNIK